MNLLKMAAVAGLIASSIAPATAGPIVMPATFDRPTVQGLIDRIEDDHNGVILEFGYFARRGMEQPLPTSDGWLLLNAAIDKEPAVSRRRFLLEAVKGFAGIHLGSKTRDDGLKAYDDVFDSAAQAEQVNASDVVARAAYELVATIPSGFAMRRAEDTSDTSATAVSKAYSAYFEYLKLHDPGIYHVPWAEAFHIIGMAGYFTGAADIALNDVNQKKTYVLLRTCAAAYQDYNPGKAIELMGMAKGVLPAGNPREKRAFYKSLVQLLEDNNRMAEAVAAEKELASGEGGSSAGMVELYIRSRDSKALDALMLQLELPTANERDITDAAEELLKCRDLAVMEFEFVRGAHLLESYLGSARKRDVDSELRARVILADLYTAERRFADATAMLKTVVIAPGDTNGMHKLYYEAAQQRIKHLSSMVTTTKEDGK